MPTAKKEWNAPLGMEAELFRSADKLSGRMETSKYNHIVLGLNVHKHISDRSEAIDAELLEKCGKSAAEAKDCQLKNCCEKIAGYTSSSRPN